MPDADSLQFRDVHAVSADTAYPLSVGRGRNWTAPPTPITAGKPVVDISSLAFAGPGGPWGRTHHEAGV